ncbi:MAG TPA: lipid-A-disaccharide synthase N-terminal domain-containing protein [Dongiaceae bacterium]|jgi:lipid-A-disaccharide synthase-like uncharacterized protein
MQITFWVIFGFVGQILFFFRFFYQWLASEAAKRSVVPEAFWYFSIAGGLVLFIYAIQRSDPVFTVGQGCGIFIYVRNIYLIRRERRQAS